MLMYPMHFAMCLPRIAKVAGKRSWSHRMKSPTGTSCAHSPHTAQREMAAERQEAEEEPEAEALGRDPRAQPLPGQHAGRGGQQRQQRWARRGSQRATAGEVCGERQGRDGEGEAERLDEVVLLE